MYDSKEELLELLEFGSVDSESEENSDNKFIKTISWLLARITDGLGGKYPREFINFANDSKEEQKNEKFDDNCLISGNAIRKAFGKVSVIKCDTYLSEFPQLRNHFERFGGRDTARYTREEIGKLMSGLELKGDDMIRAFMKRVC